MSGATDPLDATAYKDTVAGFQHASTQRALWQLANTFAPYALLWFAMYWALEVSMWLTVALAVLSGAFLVRIFIIFHDCTHGSYLSSRRANDMVGFIAGVLTFSPYQHWRWEHAIHHGSAGNLDRRGTGDVWTMTVQEYLSASWRRRLKYRLVRNPLVLFVIAPLFVFVIRQRFASAKAGRRQRHSVWWMNATLLFTTMLLSWTFGFGSYVLIQSIAMTFAGAVGLWLFYIQHQFKGVYWERGDTWDYTSAALRGSSYYKLPKVLQWISGNIGFHHIHHLSPRIPNYYLQKCHESHALFLQVQPVTLRASLQALKFRLWDEQGKELVGYAHLRRLEAERVRARSLIRPASCRLPAASVTPSRLHSARARRCLDGGPRHEGQRSRCSYQARIGRKAQHRQLLLRARQLERDAVDACLVSHRAFRTPQRIGDTVQRHAVLSKRSKLLQLVRRPRPDTRGASPRPR